MEDVENMMEEAQRYREELDRMSAENDIAEVFRATVESIERERSEDYRKLLSRKEAESDRDTAWVRLEAFRLRLDFARSGQWVEEYDAYVAAWRALLANQGISGGIDAVAEKRARDMVDG